MAQGGSGALVSDGGARVCLLELNRWATQSILQPAHTVCPLFPSVVCCRALLFSLRRRLGGGAGGAAGRVGSGIGSGGSGVRCLSCSPVRSCFGQVAGLVPGGVVVPGLCARRCAWGAMPVGCFAVRYGACARARAAGRASGLCT